MNISFSKTVSSIKKIADLTILNPKKLDKTKMSKVLVKSQNNTVCIPFESDYYWLKIIQFVRQKSERWGMKLSDDFISNELAEFICQLKIDRKKYGDMGKSVKNWLEDLKKLPVTNFRFILPVNNVDYRKDLDFGKVKLKKLNLAKLRRLASFRKQIKCFSAKETLDELISLNKTEVFAIIEVQAKDEKQGMALANSSLKRLIHVMRLFDPPSGITEREYHFSRTDFHYLVINLDKNAFSTSFSNLHTNTHVWKTDKYWKEITPYWNKLKGFLFSENLNEIQSIILSALYWYGDAGKETEDELSKFLKYTYGLENLVIFDNEYNKGKRVAERIAIIFGRGDGKNHAFYKNLLERYYDVRSEAIHAGRLVVEKEDVDTAQRLLRDLILEYIRLSKKHTDVKTMFKKEYSIII